MLKYFFTYFITKMRDQSGQWELPAAMGISAVGSLLGSSSQKKAAKKAGKYQVIANRESIAAQKAAEERARAAFAPYSELGKSAIPGLMGVDPTGGAGKLMQQLEDLGGGFKFDPENPMYKFKQAETEKGINRSLASRGLYNSRAGINALSEANTRLVAEETEKQYGRQYGRLTDLFNMSRDLGSSRYGKQLDMTNIGMGAAGMTGQAAMRTGQGIGQAYGNLGKGLAGTAMATGQAQSDMWSGLGNMPLNYMMMQKLFSNN